MRTILILSIFSISFFSCKSQRFTINDLPDTQILFGSGGGISGEVRTYTLLENGQLFFNNSLTKEHNEIESIPKKEAVAYFQKIKDLQLSQMDFNHPGNMYYFLEEINGDEKSSVVWGSNDHDISEECKALYKELRTTIK